jgi:hypothetical protein
MKYIYILDGHSDCRYNPPMSIGFFSSKKKAEEAKKKKEWENSNKSYPQFIKFTIDKVEVK